MRSQLDGKRVWGRLYLDLQASWLGLDRTSPEVIERLEWDHVLGNCGLADCKLAQLPSMQYYLQCHGQ